jgi:hypothetical protein
MAGYANTNRVSASIDDAYLRLIAEIMKSPNPFYYLCECAYQWAEIAGLELHIVYERARRGTEYEAVPFQIHSHTKWNRLGLNLKKNGVKKTFSVSS